MSTSRYKVFSTEKFRDAPLTKLWSCCTFVGSCALIPLSQQKQHFVLHRDTLFTGNQIWKLLTSKLFFLQFKDIIAGCLLIYYMRHIERRYASRKFCDFLLFTGLTAFTLEILLHYALSSSDFSLPPLFPSGPFSVIFACMVQFIGDIPFVPYANLFGVPLSVKNLPFLLAIQLLISSKEVTLSCLTGVIAGFIYRRNWFNVQHLTIVPLFLSNAISKIFGQFSTIGEDKVGRILPMGATLEAQRLDLMDRYEQRLIFKQIQRQHLNDRQGNASELFAGRRWFGRGGGETNESQASEDKIKALMDMGFANRQRVEQVLKNTNNDLSAAANILLQETTFN